MAKRADWFAADKAMAERVREYIIKKADFITIKNRRKAELDGLKAKLARYNDKDVVVIEDETVRAQRVAEIEKELETVKASYQKLIDDNATFSFTDNDKKLYKAYKAATNDYEVSVAICNWVKAYTKADGTYLDMTGTEDLVGILRALGGEKPVNDREHVNSGGVKFNGKRAQSDILKTFYGALAERMIKAGTLKTATFPEEIKAKYAPKKRNK